MAERIPVSPPVIPPLTNNDARPNWSVMIPTYNCSKFLIETLQSVLAQAKNPDEMQIEVVDDYSTDDDVEAIVNEIGKGRVSFYKQPRNVGSLRNFETCINRAKGQWVHLLHGDDVVKPGFYSEIEDLFEKNPSAGAACTGFSCIDENSSLLIHNDYIQGAPGIIPDWLLKIAKGQLLQTCAVVVKRSVYEHLGGFFAVHYGEDWEMWVRIAANYPVAYSPETLALYRVHNNNISARYLATGQNIRDIITVINIIQNYLPVEKRKEIKQRAKRDFSLYFTENAQRIYRKHKNGKVSLKQARGAVRLHFNKTTFVSLLKLYAKVVLNYKK